MNDDLRRFSTGTAETFPGSFAQDHRVISPVVPCLLPWESKELHGSQESRRTGPSCASNEGPGEYGPRVCVPSVENAPSRGRSPVKDTTGFPDEEIESVPPHGFVDPPFPRVVSLAQLDVVFRE
jgi:hypothetical protein